MYFDLKKAKIILWCFYILYVVIPYKEKCLDVFMNLDLNHHCIIF